MKFKILLLLSLSIVFFILVNNKIWNADDHFLDFSVNESCDESSSFRIEDGFIYFLDEKKPYSGKSICYYKKESSHANKLDHINQNPNLNPKYKAVNYENGVREGKWTFWHDNGQKKSEGYFKNGKEHGKWTAWYWNGNVQIEANGPRFNKNGSWVWRADGGQKKSEGSYKDDMRDGQWIWWQNNGKIKYEANYKDGQCIEGDC
jgi:antitoxin component YwqK of YwqJK toxin-antitoxin module